ncbi:RidA family protein [Mesorhizobium sp. M1A.F.Ca.ET.072.01.1.1]|uniref:RidA family protein n=1 Tax=Mesorhizobium sp. M1A.F.Ca.ET.072.01.1.1 TaxID=2496753 RepID=UPI000FD46ED7|nr:RidA family protein [Mesorhizobium sp. M1A.F.Ca.ET.072.01.1.1]RUW47261.1 RidA family protein [Mesorhizobium sp. M1A.F.Ca.ET.072.01.1.1]TIV02591.1 MAG: RidA family protein [Mesorhizobium sp.]
MVTRHIKTEIMHRVVEYNGVLYFGGLVAGDCSQDMKGQTEQICEKIDNILAQLGSSKEKIITAMIYISDFSQKSGMNEGWLKWLPPNHLPARATIGVANLGENVLVEVVISAAK